MGRYSNIPILKTKSGISHYRGVIYPEIPFNPKDIYVTTDALGRLDILAHEFYGNSLDYWVIAIANPSVIDFGSIYVPKGVQIRIPFDLNGIKSEFSKINM